MKLLTWTGDLRIPAEDRARANVRFATLDDVRAWAAERGYRLAPAEPLDCGCDE